MVCGTPTTCTGRTAALLPWKWHVDRPGGGCDVKVYVLIDLKKHPIEEMTR
jgi:hypothetical protein